MRVHLPRKVLRQLIKDCLDKNGIFIVAALATLEKFTGQKVARVLSDSDFKFHTYVKRQRGQCVVIQMKKRLTIQ